MANMMAHMTERFRTTTFADIAEIPVVDGSIRWKPVRRTLGITAFGTNAYVADAGQEVVEPHDEQLPDSAGGHEELYVVVAGHARFTIDGDDVDAPVGTLVFLPEPAAHRQAVALEDGTTVMAIGAEPGVPYRVSAWEHNFAAEADAARGDFGAAAETVRGALPEHDDNPAVHYNIASHLVRAGQQDDALAELRRAVELAPEKARGWAAEDAALWAPLRDCEGFPA
jgi:mannose-6-phosphate isomerase-like protein (cupin superfamily)